MMEGAETESEPTVAPALDSHDAAAVAALLIRIVRIDEQMAIDKHAVAEATARITANTLARSKTITAFGVFGFDLSEGLWPRVEKSLGRSAYIRAIRLGKGIEEPGLLQRMGDESQVSGESAMKFKNADASEDEGSINNRTPRIKDAILAYLVSAGEGGVTARSVRQHLAEVHNLDVHEKTPGMTLYRLLKDGQVRRDGRSWFAVSAIKNNENEAPDGGATGASDAEGVTAPSNKNRDQFDELLG